jgi:hypothetical protein
MGLSPGSRMNLGRGHGAEKSELRNLKVDGRVRSDGGVSVTVDLE